MFGSWSGSEPCLSVLLHNTLEYLIEYIIIRLGILGTTYTSSWSLPLGQIPSLANTFYSDIKNKSIVEEYHISEKAHSKSGIRIPENLG